MAPRLVRTLREVATAKRTRATLSGFARFCRLRRQNKKNERVFFVKISELPLDEVSWKRAAAQMKFNEWNERDFVVLDTETTGLYDAEICEISVIDQNGKTLFSSFVKPKNGIPWEAQSIHGISEEMVKDAPSWPEVWKQLYPILRDRLILIYNEEFDTRLMVESFLPYLDDPFKETEEDRQIKNLETDCVMRTYADLVGSHKWLKLTEAAGRQIAHRALDDCRATLEVIKKCYDPGFTEEKYERVEAYHRLKNINHNLRLTQIHINRLVERQGELLKEQQQLQKKYLLGIEPEAEEVAASASYDISDDDLPF
jgi:DNA polymerase III epsilon subunit-like protein